MNQASLDEHAQYHKLTLTLKRDLHIEAAIGSWCLAVKTDKLDVRQIRKSFPKLVPDLID